MSRTRRRYFGRGAYDEPADSNLELRFVGRRFPEKGGKPRCGCCGKDATTIHTDRVRTRRAGKREIADQLASA